MKKKKKKKKKREEYFTRIIARLRGGKGWLGMMGFHRFICGVNDLPHRVHDRYL